MLLFSSGSSVSGAKKVTHLFNNIGYVTEILANEDALLELGQEHIPETAAQAGSKYRQIIRIKAVHFMTIFAVIYIGVEVTLGGKYISPEVIRLSSCFLQAGS